MPDIDIDWHSEPKEEFEDSIKKDKETILNDAANSESENENSESENAESAKGSVATLLSMIWNSATKGKDYEPITYAEHDFLVLHSARFEQKYAGKLSIMQYPELEFAVALFSVIAPKVYKHYEAKNNADAKKDDNNESKP